MVTGGAGFIGARLARELLAQGALGVAGEAPRPLSRLTLIDRAPVPDDLAVDGRVTSVRADLADLRADVIFHLAAAVSAECEADFDLGMRATQALLAACRAQRGTPVVVYASSLAVFGGSRDHPLPAVIDDQTAPNPQTSYGIP